MSAARRHGGFVLVAVVFALTAMTALVLALHAKVRSSIKTVEAMARATQALCGARAGLEVARSVVCSGRQRPSQAFVLDLDGCQCTVEISDEQGRFNLNYLLDGQLKPDPERLSQLSRLMDLAGVEASSAAQALVGYLVERGQMADTNSPGPLRTLDELAGIKGLQDGAVRTLVRYVTVWGDGRINLNAAPEPVLRAILDPVDPALARQVLALRSAGRLADMDALRMATAARGRLAARLADYTDVGRPPRYFRVVCRGRSGTVQRTLWAVLYANPALNTADVLAYREEDMDL